jgi:hypothetical protein
VVLVLNCSGKKKGKDEPCSILRVWDTPKHTTPGPDFARTQDRKQAGGESKTVTCQQAKLVDGGGSQDTFGEGERLGNDTR